MHIYTEFVYIKKHGLAFKIWLQWDVLSKKLSIKFAKFSITKDIKKTLNQHKYYLSLTWLHIVRYFKNPLIFFYILEGITCHVMTNKSGIYIFV